MIHFMVFCHKFKSENAMSYTDSVTDCHVSRDGLSCISYAAYENSGMWVFNTNSSSMNSKAMFNARFNA